MLATAVKQYKQSTPGLVCIGMHSDTNGEAQLCASACKMNARVRTNISCMLSFDNWYHAQLQQLVFCPASATGSMRCVYVLQELTRLQESESGLDSPRADSELDLATSDFSTPDLLQVVTLFAIIDSGPVY